MDCAAENFLRLAWNSTEKEFDKMKQQIEAHVQNFESEARLAETEANRKWQEDVMDKLSERTAVSRSTSTLVQPVATLPFPRNLIFTGREEVFEDIGKILQPSGADDQEEMRSIALYGVGGVGKTQTALEYAYRCKANYSHIFWIKSETEVELRQSLFAMVKALSMDQGEDSEHKAMELALKWLNATREAP